MREVVLLSLRVVGCVKIPMDISATAKNQEFHVEQDRILGKGNR